MNIHDRVRFVNPSHLMNRELLEREGDMAVVKTCMDLAGFYRIQFDEDRDCQFGWWLLRESQMELIE